MPDNCTNNPRDCPMVHRIESLESANERHGKTHGEMYNRLNALERENAVQVEQYNSIIKELAALTASHNSLNQKLSALEQKPGKRWEGIVDKAIWAVCAAVIAFLLAKLGLSS